LFTIAERASCRPSARLTTGTKDFGADGETPPWRLAAFDSARQGDKFAVVVEGFPHVGFDPPAGDIAHGTVLRQDQLAFWDGVLRGEQSALLDLRQRARTSKETDPVWIRAR